MIFEEQVSKLYNEIANDVSDMIPDKWENIYLKAYVMCLQLYTKIY